ncbi:MAG TPA: hypothetical protein VLC95_18080 [Anaerolineae bacterium]|nr:hypothetical protein [Anaerolineae bacterium]
MPVLSAMARPAQHNLDVDVVSRPSAARQDIPRFPFPPVSCTEEVCRE